MLWKWILSTAIEELYSNFYILTNSPKYYINYRFLHEWLLVFMNNCCFLIQSKIEIKKNKIQEKFQIIPKSLTISNMIRTEERRTQRLSDIRIDIFEFELIIMRLIVWINKSLLQPLGSCLLIFACIDLRCITFSMKKFWSHQKRLKPFKSTKIR